MRREHPGAREQSAELFGSHPFAQSHRFGELASLFALRPGHDRAPQVRELDDAGGIRALGIAAGIERAQHAAEVREITRGGAHDVELVRSREAALRLHHEQLPVARGHSALRADEQGLALHGEVVDGRLLEPTQVQRVRPRAQGQLAGGKAHAFGIAYVRARAQMP